MVKKMRWMAVAVVAVLMSSCGHMYVNSKSYGESGGVSVNGAQVRSAVKPMGGSSGFSFSAMVYTAGAGKVDGPFIWRIEATGEEGVHRYLTVHRLRVTTEKTRRSEWYPRRYLGERVEFRPLRDAPGRTFAQFQMPGKLEVYPEQDGAIRIEAEVSVQTTSRTQRRLVRFKLDPSGSKDVEFFFLPAEIAKGFGGEDPTEWKW